MTVAAFLLVVTMFFGSAAYELYADTKKAIDNEILSSKTSISDFVKFFVLHRSFGPFVVSAIIWFLVFHMPLWICCLLFVLYFIANLAYVPIKRKIQLTTAERRKKKYEKTKQAIREVLDERNLKG
ncbi:hypothetical protein [Neobacillus massiliamazoniensis]|uniref:Uncharacterized protein n=1 Tax=Neobacillus massiliamazoniensis TaxID=1499688 RepID=A0A0U1P4V6_9BACI|nr:hypothetical protein [Neobacillus massiliamazoniensis]CRK85228.1 hypothetical protein BN000_05300 [Neobacillus massiliamazoniensis]